MATRARKRLFHEVADFASVTTPHPNANIHAAVTTLSPVKKGRSSIYFDGTLTDGTSKIRMVGFSSDQRKKLASFADSSQSVQLINCEIKQSREGDKMEIILKKFTDIKKSPKDIDTSNLDPTDTAETSSEITLDKNQRQDRDLLSQIDNIGDVEDFSDSDAENDSNQIFNPTLFAVPRLDSYKACMHCKARVEAMSHPLGRCLKCSLLQRMDKCTDQVSAKITVQSGTITKHLHGFGRILQDITGSNEVTQEALLLSEPLSALIYNSNDVIVGFTR